MQRTTFLASWIRFLEVVHLNKGIVICFFNENLFYRGLHVQLVTTQAAEEKLQSFDSHIALFGMCQSNPQIHTHTNKINEVSLIKRSEEGMFLGLHKNSSMPP